MIARDGQITALTHDHTLASILIELGELTESEAEDHELSQRTISRFLSTSTEVELDRVDGFGAAALRRMGPEIAERGLTVRTGDIFILTSDGAHGEVTSEGLALLVDQFAQRPQELCDAICQNALKRIGRDNSTVLVVRVE